MAAAPTTARRDRQIAKLIDLVVDLDGGACMFDLCPGPDEKFVPMMTCRACEVVQLARRLKVPRR